MNIQIDNIPQGLKRISINIDIEGVKMEYIPKTPEPQVQISNIETVDIENREIKDVPPEMNMQF